MDPSTATSPEASVLLSSCSLDSVDRKKSAQRQSYSHMQTWMHITHGMHDESELSHCRATNPRETEGREGDGGRESKNNQHEQKTTWRCQKLRSKERQKLQGSQIESGRWRRKHWWRLRQRMSNLGWIFILFYFTLFCGMHIKRHLQWQRWCYVGENSVKVVLVTFYNYVTYKRTQSICCEWLWATAASNFGWISVRLTELLPFLLAKVN